MSPELKFVVCENAFNVVPEEMTGEQEQELAAMNKECLWQHVCEYSGVEDAIELHDLHQEIYKGELELMDTLYKVVCKIPNLNVAYMNILAQTGRVDELNEYLRKLL